MKKTWKGKREEGGGGTELVRTGGDGDGSKMEMRIEKLMKNDGATNRQADRQADHIKK
jgi:hypothetical protein